MSSKQVARLLCKGIISGVDHIPDSWFHAIPGGYFKAKEKVEQKVEQTYKEHSKQPHRASSVASSSGGRRRRRDRDRRRRQRVSRSETDHSDSDSDSWANSDDDYFDEEKYMGTGRRPNDRRANKNSSSWDRDRRHRHSRTTSLPPSPYAADTRQTQPEYFGQYPSNPLPSYNNSGPRPYNPAEYASIPADGTTVPHMQQPRRRESQSVNSTSSWVESQARQRQQPKQNINAIIPHPDPSVGSFTPPYPTPPYDYSPRGGSAVGYPAPGQLPPTPQSPLYSPQYSTGVNRASSVRDVQRGREYSGSRSKRPRSSRARSTSLPRSQNTDRSMSKKSKRDKFGTPALAAITSGLVASEVGGAGGIGTLAGAAIGGIAMHVYEKRAKSKSRSREKPIKATREPVTDITESDWEREKEAYQRDREEERERRHRGRDDRRGDRERRSYSDGYQSD